MDLLRQEGPKALFAGVLPALVLVINPILQYTIFEQLKNVVERRRRMTPKDAFYLGALGKIMATSLTYPYITIKSRAHVASKDGPKESLNGSLKRIIQEEGWKGLYKGKQIFGSYTGLLFTDISSIRYWAQGHSERHHCCIPFCV
jgi:adenine nucleotide transporter 17